METKIESQGTTDVLKIIAAVTMLGVALVGFYYYSDVPNLYRIVALIVVVGIALMLYTLSLIHI